MNRRDLLVRLALLASGVGGAWWVRDHVLWRRPTLTFAPGAGEDWLAYDAPRVIVPTVRATVGGQTVRALIDSGAQYSVIDRGLFEALGRASTFDMPLLAYGVGGRPQVGRGATLDIAVGGLRIAALRAAILSLGPLARPEGLSAPLILGQDVLGQGVLDLDTTGRRLRLLPGDAAPPEGVAPVAVKRSGRGLAVAVTVEGATIEAAVDTGASALLALSRGAAEGAGLLDGRPERDGSSIVLGGAMASTVVEARTVAVAGQRYERVETPIYPDVALPGFPAALLGMAAFEGRRVVMDLAGGRLFVSRLFDLTVEPRRQGRV